MFEIEDSGGVDQTSLSGDASGDTLRLQWRFIELPSDLSGTSSKFPWSSLENGWVVAEYWWKANGEMANGDVTGKQLTSNWVEPRDELEHMAADMKVKVLGSVGVVITHINQNGNVSLGLAETKRLSKCSTQLHRWICLNNFATQKVKNQEDSNYVLSLSYISIYFFSLVICKIWLNANKQYQYHC